MKLSDILSGIQPRRTTGSLDIDIGGLARDSRKVSPGYLFFALSGTFTDGNRYVKEAVDRGAAAVLSALAPPPAPFSLARWATPGQYIAWIQVEDPLAAMSHASAHFYGEPSRSMTVLGVTGTNGKTTTTYFIESILTRAGAVTGVLGTNNYRLRGKEIEKAPNTTPLSMDLQRLLQRMHAGGATHVAMEVSSHALALGRVDDVEFDAAIFTNLYLDHLDYHKTEEKYFEAKAKLFDLLSRLPRFKRNKAAILNADDPAFLKFKRRVIDADILTYGLSPKADLHAAGIIAGLDGTRCRIRRHNDEWEVKLKLVGDYNVYNALAAGAAGFWLGYPSRTIIEGLEALSAVPGRLEPVSAGQPFHIFVDYAHTESALKLALRCVKKLPHRRLITVFGCGGDRDKSKRGPMGVAACDLSDFAVLTNDNPRTEDPMEILYQIEEGIKTAGRQNYKIVADRREAISEAVRMAQAGDAVVIAGKGHETYQILKDRTVSFDDRQAAREAVLRCKTGK